MACKQDADALFQILDLDGTVSQEQKRLECVTLLLRGRDGGSSRGAPVGRAVRGLPRLLSGGRADERAHQHQHTP
jgi:hypothetical protein